MKRLSALITSAAFAALAQSACAQAGAQERQPNEPSITELAAALQTECGPLSEEVMKTLKTLDEESIEKIALARAMRRPDSATTGRRDRGCWLVEELQAR